MTPFSHVPHAICQHACQQILFGQYPGEIQESCHFSPPPLLPPWFQPPSPLAWAITTSSHWSPAFLPPHHGKICSPCPEGSIQSKPQSAYLLQFRTLPCDSEVKSPYHGLEGAAGSSLLLPLTSGTSCSTYLPHSLATPAFLASLRFCDCTKHRPTSGTALTVISACSP